MEEIIPEEIVSILSVETDDKISINQQACKINYSDAVISVACDGFGMFVDPLGHHQLVHRYTFSNKNKMIVQVSILCVHFMTFTHYAMYFIR